ncbi:hypothetical protein FSP39_005935 [Pinctada imbricata]|uniref:Thrombospondin-like N-terminal domain-containing protein n=1 Tax=Pinctada imbricata TaxID=66713 RepID=A0AA88XCJ7_PINIB|nr:hypothetical protein FSP39_005935 [Pinctada imbricata]
MKINFFSVSEIDLLAAIGIPSQTPGISYTSGIEGYPALRISDCAYIRVAAQALLKDRLYDNFALTLTLLSGQKSGGMLFAVKDPAEALVQFGLELTPVNSANKQELVLYWTQNPRIAKRTVQIATFEIDSITQKWTKLGLKVENKRISLYVNCKLEDTKTYDRGSNVLDGTRVIVVYSRRGTKF